MNRRLKRAFYNSLAATGLAALIRPLLNGRGTILMFHRVLADPPATDYGPSADLAVSPEAFRRTVEYLRKSGHDIVSLDEGLQRLRGKSADRRFACLTFDDGYRDNYEIVFPLCKEMEIPFTIYVTTGMIDGQVKLWWYGLEEIIHKNELLRLPQDFETQEISTRTFTEKAAAYDRVDTWMRRVTEEARAGMIEHLERTYDFDFAALSLGQTMTWQMVKELAESELAEIAGHTVSHPTLSKLPEAEARREIEQGREILQSRTGRPVRHFAYPFGSVAEAGEREFEICRDLGFVTATTTRAGNLLTRHGNSAHSLPRIAVVADETIATLKVDLTRVPGMMRAISHALRGG